MSQGPLDEHPTSSSAPIALDALAYGIDALDAILVLHLGDARLHAAWVRPESGLRMLDLSSPLRDAYRTCQLAARRVASPGGASAPERRADSQSPLVTLEIPVQPWSPPEPAGTGGRARPSPDAAPPMPPCRTAMLRRVRSHVVAFLFDPAMPLGMARVIAARLTASIEPELPRADDRLGEGLSPSISIPFDMGRDETRVLMEAARLRSALATAADGSVADPHLGRALRPEDHAEREPTTLTFGAGVANHPGRAFAAEPRVTRSEIERVGKLLAYFDAHAPEPHVARYRLALRAGLTLVELEHPEALGPEALVLIETAVEEILGVGSAELRRIA